MPIVAAAVVPHSPLLVPALAGRHTDLFAVTHEQLKNIGAETLARQPDVMIIFTPHGPLVGQEMTANVSDHYVGRLVEFGDQTTRIIVDGASHVAQECAEVATEFGSHLSLVTRPELDYGCTVPLSFFSEQKSLPPVLPIAISHQPIDRVIRFCQALEEFTHRSPLRFALIASADLVPRGDHPDPRPQPLERAIGQAIGQVNAGSLLNHNDPSVCGLWPVIALLSCLQTVVHDGSVRSFQAPLAVGLMTASIDVPS